MSEIETWLLAIGITSLGLCTIIWGIQWDINKRFKKLESEAWNIYSRISKQNEKISELNYISKGLETSFNINTGIKNPNIGVKEIQRRVELILDRLGVEVDDSPRLVEVDK